MNVNREIVSDVRRVADNLGRTTLSGSEYVQHGRFSLYQIYDGGTTWEEYCRAAGVESRRKEEVPDDIYFGRLVQAIKELGRHPKASERKKFGLNFSKRRFPTLSAFLQAAIERGIIEGPKDDLESPNSETSQKAAHIPDTVAPSPTGNRPVPPIPSQTSRRNWGRIDVPGFPYAPQDESGTVALFAILCAIDAIQWDIVEINAGKGIDCICWDHVMKREVRVELKHTLARTGWNHPLGDLDYVVCWENRWPDFEKPVIVLRDLTESLKERNLTRH